MGRGMAFSQVSIGNDAEHFASLMRPASTEVLATKRGPFRAKIIRIDLGELWMQRGEENAPRVMRAAPTPGRMILSFLTGPGSSLRDGIEVPSGSITLFSQREPRWHVTTGPSRWGSLSVPLSIAAGVGDILAGRQLDRIDTQCIVQPAEAAMRRLMQLHGAAADLAEEAPERLGRAEVARAIEQQIIEAMADCLTHATHVTAPPPTQRVRRAIVDRFREMVSRNLDQPLYMPEVCIALGVPGRSLRFCCQELLGISPKRYLTLRRLHLARRALRVARAGETSVTEVATSLGFWQLGRFAVAYKQAFGESPQSTLRAQGPRDA
jgi:AraC-like DNA-binding protein